MKNKYLTILLATIASTIAPFIAKAVDAVDLGPPGNFGPGQRNLPSLIKYVTGWVLGIAGALAILFIIISGIQYLVSAGNKDMVEKAKKGLTAAITGLVIILCAYIIATTVATILGARY